MELIFDSSLPIYQQIMSHFKRMLACGQLKAGERVASVRELAAAYGVNPNTMQKALSELERDGCLYSERTAGRMVTQDQAFIEKLRADALREAARRFTDETTALGATRKELPDILSAYLEETMETEE